MTECQEKCAKQDRSKNNALSYILDWPALNFGLDNDYFDRGFELLMAGSVETLIF